MASHDPDPTEGAAPPLLSEPQLRFLKYAVVTMGVMLFAGFLIIIGRIIYLIANAPPTPITAMDTGPAGFKADVPLPLPPGAVVRHVSLSGNRLAVSYDVPGGGTRSIAIVDLISGRIVSEVNITSGPTTK